MADISAVRGGGFKPFSYKVLFALFLLSISSNKKAIREKNVFSYLPGRGGGSWTGKGIKSWPLRRRKKSQIIKNPVKTENS